MEADCCNKCSGGVGLTADTDLPLANVDGSDVKIELGNLANGYVQATTATPTSLGNYGLNETNGAGHTKSICRYRCSIKN